MLMFLSQVGSHSVHDGNPLLSEPLKIQAPSKKRDYFESNSEMFGVLFDTFNDKENALAFYTTPTGLRWDGSVSNDAEVRHNLDVRLTESPPTCGTIRITKRERVAWRNYRNGCGLPASC
jgi:hypothetical protein